MKHQLVANVCVKYYSCATCAKGIEGGLKASTYLLYCSEHHSYRKNVLLKTLNFTTSKELNYHSFQATGLIFESKALESCALQSKKEFSFLIFELKKITFSGISVFRQKRTISNKFYHSKTKMKFVKNYL